MVCQNTYFELGEYAHNLIRNKARRLIGKAGFTETDREDIEQELALDLLVRLENYDPTRGKRTTFMARVVDNRIATMLADRHAACRDWRLCRDSLDESDCDAPEEGACRIDNLPDPATPTREDLAMKMDLPKVVEALPEDLREIWNRLLITPKISRVARELGIPRSTLYYRIGRLRAALRDAGL